MTMPTEWRREGNLPVELTSFVGRERVLAEVRRRLAAHRLVTITGIGGVGKSRTALRLAHTVREEYPDGAWYVDLSRLYDPSLLVHTVVAALGIADQSARPEIEALADWLAGRRLLLLLDGCEHLIDACAALVQELLQKSSGLRILATSRRSLNVPGEQALPIQPLEVPGAGPAEDLYRNEAVRLFAERGAAVVPGFRVDAGNVAAVAELCARLDGIPLAIELAAVRRRALSVAQILALLTDRFSLLAGTSRTALPRHQTLRAAIGWSHELCTPAERLLWARLSVFAGDFELTAAAEVCHDEHLSRQEVMRLIPELVEKSILVSQHNPIGMRYRLLDTLREYGREWLDKLGETETFRRRHRDYYLDLAEEGDQSWSGQRQQYWFTRMRYEHDNIRLALEYCLTEPAEARAGLRLLSALWFMWVACGFSRAGRMYLERALACSPEPGAERCRALWVLSYIRSTQGDLEGALAAAEQCSQEAVRIGDTGAVLLSTKMQGTASALAGDLQKAKALLGVAIEFHRGGRELNPGLLPAIVELAFVLTAENDVEQAESLLKECLEVCERSGEQWLRSHAYWALALTHIAGRRTAEALEDIRQALRIKLNFHDVLGMVMALEAAARVVAAEGDALSAARLLGAAEANWRLFGLPLFGSPFLTAEHEQTVADCKRLIGADRYEEQVAAGRRLSLDEAVRYVLDEALPVAV